MRWAILVFGLAQAGCNSDDSARGHVDVGCDGGGSCKEDFSITGICTQDLPHMCFCGANGDAAPPNGDCAGNAVVPPAPNSRAYCCP